MHLWGIIRKSPRVYYVLTRNRSQPGENTGHTRNDLFENSERGIDANKKDCRPQQVHLQSYRHMSTFLQNPKAGFCLDK